MQKIFFIGIKGAGMSALARILHAQGHMVMGSDIEKYVFTEDGLLADGIKIVPFSEQNFNDSYDVIIRGNALHSDNNIEVAYLEKQGIEPISYYTFLQTFLEDYTSFAVTGTHGKTTTTGLLAALFVDEPLACLIGDGTGFSDKDAKYFIFESCEYKRHFLNYYPDYAIITNVEYDHPDYFKDLADTIDAYTAMSRQVKEKVVVFGDDPGIQAVIAAGETGKFITYGFAATNDYVIKAYEATSQGIHFELWYQGQKEDTFDLPFYGQHMLLDAVAAMILGRIANKSWKDIETNISTYQGVKRRFNIETFKGYTIVDDYAHHPTEIQVTLDAARQKYPNKEIVAIFQPHTFTRTEALADDFIDVLKNADVVYLTDIFGSAREQRENTKPDLLLDALTNAHFLERTNVDVLQKHQDSILIFMGAGDIQEYMKSFKENA